MSSLSYEVSGGHGTSVGEVLFLHGFMGRASDWRPVISGLGGRYRCVAVDLPGHGSSLGLPEGSYTMKGTADTVLRLLDELGLHKPVVVGYSMGGRLALYLALRHPERCAGLFLESASPGLKIGRERASRRRADEERARRLETGDFEKFLRDWHRQPLFESLSREKDLLNETIKSKKHNDPQELAKSLRGMGTGSQPSLWGELPGLRVPALAVAGELDEKYVEISRRMARLTPSMEGAVVPGVGHNVHVETPEAYLASLRGLLVGNQGSK